MMAKNIRRMLAMVLVLCMFVGAVPLQALAADGTETSNSTETSPEGLTTNVTTTTTTTTDDSGKTTVTVTIDKSTSGTTDDGVDVNRTENSTTTTTTNADGDVTREHWSEDGKETKAWTEEDTGNGNQTEVTVNLVPGEKTTGTAEESTTVTDENGTTKTTTTDRTVTTTTTKAEVTVNDSNTGLVGDEEAVLNGPAPVYDKDENGKKEDKDGLFDRNYLSTNTTSNTSKWNNIPPEGEYRYIGKGEQSKYYVGAVTVIYRKDENGNTVYDEYGNPVIKQLVNQATGTPHTSDGEDLDEIVPEYEIDDGFAGNRAQTFMLMDKNGNRVYAYCCDLQTVAVGGTWYSVSNLEDSEYYTPEAEGHIRAIATNGYWGTTDVPDENNGEYALGSLEGIKAKMIEAIKNGEIERYVQVPVRDTSTAGAGKIQVDEDGNPIYYEEKMDLLDILESMTEGEALLATQAAIWSFANGSEGATSGIDGPVVITPDWYRNHQIGYSKREGEPLDDEAGARVAAMYNWLMNLEPEEESTIVINDKNFIEDMSLTVGDKAADYEANRDDDKDNDVYNASLNFTLAFVPGANDDLLVQIKYTDLDGKDVTVIRRLAGENAEGQSYEAIEPEDDGSYVLKGLKLSENKDFNFDLHLEGTQYLENGVYVYSAVGGRDVSQAFVGVAEGTRNVDVSVGMTIKFDVDENNHVVAERTWHNESDPTYTPEDTPGGPNEEPEEPAGPRTFRLGRNDGTVEIPDEEVPLAEAPITGDESVLWIAVILMAAAALYVVNVISKKRQHEAF